MVDPNKKFDLDVPVDVGGENYSSLTLRRPKGREVRALRNGSGRGDAVGDITFKMIADLAEVEEAVLDELDAADYRKIENWLETLLGN